jgi:hypothetical protein
VVLALQLIDIGYKVLSVKLHPDKGGSHDAMRRLNKVRHPRRTSPTDERNQRFHESIYVINAKSLDSFFAKGHREYLAAT